MSLLIEIVEQPKSRKGNNAAGRPYEIITQRAYIHKSTERYPEETVVPIESINDAHKEGYYELVLEDCITTGDFKSLSFARYPSLKQAQSPKQAQTS